MTRFFIGLIPVEIPGMDRVGLGIDVPPDVLARIDALSERRGLDREGFLLRAAEHELEHV